MMCCGAAGIAWTSRWRDRRRGCSRARGPRAVAPAEPQVGEAAEFGLRIVARAGVFGGASLDIGTRALLEVADQWPAYATAIDLAWRNRPARRRAPRGATPQRGSSPDDVSSVAVESARLTAEANGVVIDSVQDDGLAQQPTDRRPISLC